jgi:hypothetical protein
VLEYGGNLPEIIFCQKSTKQHMKQHEIKTKRPSRFLRRDGLPLLRGMFVYPESPERLLKLHPSESPRFLANDDKAIIGI